MAEVAAEVIEVKEEEVGHVCSAAVYRDRADNQTQDEVPIPVGPDGWPIDLESATTSQGEDSQVSLCL